MIRTREQRISTLNPLHLSPDDEDNDASPDLQLLRDPTATKTYIEVTIM